MMADKVLFYFKANILDKLPEEIREKVAIGGGAVRDKLLGVDIKDIDMFVEDQDTEDKLMAFFKEKGKEGIVNSQLANYTYEGRWIQIIRGKFYNMKTTELIDSFDFTICMAMITTDGLKVGDSFYQSVATKHLRINKITFPLSTLERLQKYVKKGYTACNGTLLEIAKSINDMRRDVFTPGAEGDGFQSINTANTLLFYSDGSPRFMGVD